MNKETTSNVFTLEDLEEAKDNSGLIKSYPLNIIWAILQGKIIDEKVWNYIFDPEIQMQDTLLDVLKLLPHSREFEKKKIVDILMKRDYFNENRLRDWLHEFKGSEELYKYLLSQYFNSKESSEKSEKE